jgi:hypothetical protein
MPMVTYLNHDFDVMGKWNPETCEINITFPVIPLSEEQKRQCEIERVGQLRQHLSTRLIRPTFEIFGLGEEDVITQDHSPQAQDEEFIPITGGLGWFHTTYPKRINDDRGYKMIRRTANTLVSVYSDLMITCIPSNG